MRIGIDVRSLARLNTGIGNHTYNLLKCLFRLAKDDEFVVYSCRKIEQSIFGETSNVTVKQIFFPIGTLWSQTILPLQLLKDDIHVFHSPETMVPIVGNIPSVATVHDLISIIHPKGHDLKARIAANLYSLVFKKVSRLIAVSQSTKCDLKRIYGIDDKMISVIPNSFDEDLFKPTDDSGNILNTYGVKSPYILAVGVLSPRKNANRLVEAYKRVLKRGLNVDLVFVGPRGWQYKGVFAKVNELGLDERVHFIGPVPSSVLPAFYAGSSAFVFPSIYEGFGIPILEAMACGTPVIASNTSSMPEVAGAAAVMVDPYNITEIADAIYDLISNPEKAELLRKKGVERVKGFSWKKTAENTLKVYHEVAGL